MSEQVIVSDPVNSEAERVSEERDVSKKEAIAIMCREGGYDV